MIDGIFVQFRSLGESELAAHYFLILYDLINAVLSSVLNIIDHQIVKHLFNLLSELIMWDFSPVILQISFLSCQISIQLLERHILKRMSQLEGTRK